jgi:hypothetical protein
MLSSFNLESPQLDGIECAFERVQSKAQRRGIAGSFKELERSYARAQACNLSRSVFHPIGELRRS